MSKKYQKKPIVVEAVQWTGYNLEEVKEFAKYVVYEIYDAGWKAGVCPPSTKITLQTLEGVMTVQQNDYIIKGINGEFYPCKPDIFEKTYDEIKTGEATE
jgi:hypothetical protein